MPAPQSNNSPFFVQAVILIGFGIAAYLMFSLATSVYKNYLIDQHIKSFEEENVRLAAENLQKKEDYDYYISEAYLEKTAKESLSLKKPGEEVIILVEDDIKSEKKSLNLSEDNFEDEDIDPQEAWYEYFFGEKSPFLIRLSMD